MTTNEPQPLRFTGSERFTNNAVGFHCGQHELARISSDGILHVKVDPTEENATKFIACVETVLNGRQLSGIKTKPTLYEMAGKLFGEIQQLIKFGELSMSLKENTFTYTWTFKAKGESHLINWGIYKYEFMDERAPTAEFIVNVWKDFNRKALE
jgi:hypothetical protein